MCYLKNNEIDEFIEFNKKMYPLRRGLEESILYKLHHPYISRTDDIIYTIIVAKIKIKDLLDSFKEFLVNTI